MTMQIDGNAIMEAIQIARIVGTVVMVVLVALVIAWAVRPSRRIRETREMMDEAGDQEALWGAVERMEERLEVLERAMADQVERPQVRSAHRDRILAPAEDSRDSGRME
ncbi:MAG: CcoQ/FixQ family Cbb3-type cytochrome c oxidase assembly chaperone [Sphingomonadaceae bacterium]|nr:CcoQ/FixQ family Cbb3-type cytochrome c oxidase assembly chaperone [Sphingomonadaceae bacterium]